MYEIFTVGKLHVEHVMYEYKNSKTNNWKTDSRLSYISYKHAQVVQIFILGVERYLAHISFFQ